MFFLIHFRVEVSCRLWVRSTQLTGGHSLSYQTETLMALCLFQSTEIFSERTLFGNVCTYINRPGWRYGKGSHNRMRSPRAVGRKECIIIIIEPPVDAVQSSWIGDVSPEAAHKPLKWWINYWRRIHNVPWEKWCYGCGQLFVFVFALLLDAREIRFVWWSIKFFPSCPEFRTMLSVTVEMDKIWTNYELLESTCNLYLSDVIATFVRGSKWSLRDCWFGFLTEGIWTDVICCFIFFLLNSIPNHDFTTFFWKALSLWNRKHPIDVMVAWPTTKHDNVNEKKKKLFMILATDIWYDNSVHCNMNANRRKT